MAIKLHLSHYGHPGPWLKLEIVEPHGMSITEVAMHMGVSRQNMSLLLNGHAALSALMALRFEQAFGISADTLLRMQAAYDLAQARQRAGELKVAPVREAA